LPVWKIIPWSSEILKKNSSDWGGIATWHNIGWETNNLDKRVPIEICE